VLALIFLASTIAYVIAVLSEVPERTLLYQGANTLPQVGLVAVAAALVSYFVDEYQQARSRSDANLGVLQDILSAITAAYSGLKTSRRMMRAQGLRLVDGAVSVLTLEYDTLLAVVDTVQLRFERLVQDVAANDIFGDQAGCMRALKRIEQALHEIRDRIGAGDASCETDCGQPVCPASPLTRAAVSSGADVQRASTSARRSAASASSSGQASGSASTVKISAPA
jgi:hypothetical protein